VDPSPVPQEPDPAGLDLSSIPTGDLEQNLSGQFSPDTYGGFQIIPLATPTGSPPLWAAFSTGMRSFETDPIPSHFVSLQTYTTQGGWQELARFFLDEGAGGGGPDYIDPSGVRQVLVEPAHLWVEVEGGIGAHGGIYELLMYDGSRLIDQAWGSSPAPGAGRLQDLNADGLQEVILNTSDPYIFAYATGVRKPGFALLTWDGASQRMAEVGLQPVPADQAGAARAEINRAVEMAQAGLWKDAKIIFDQARFSGGEVPVGDAFTWDAALIDLYANSIAADIQNSAFPMMIEVYYGDYPAAVERLRLYPVEQLFTAQPALLQNSVVTGFESSLSAQIIESASAAIAVSPELAPAYFLRGWAAYIANPADPQAAADVALAASLAPEDGLFAQAALFLGG
jgi:hypothetical protein